jgi:mono/diheme cytochrome c family protein
LTSEERIPVQRKLRLIKRIALSTLMVWNIAGYAQESHIGKLVGHASRGRALYQRYCVYCHGPLGDGRGESAPYLNPKPRDFTKAAFKCRSTPSGSLPLDTDLYDTITRGVHASGMPSWRPLLKQERADLVAYVKAFSSSFQEEKPGAPVEIPAEPPSSAESIQRGSELFQSMNCWSCHGKQGRGDGPSAASLTDSKGNPITPFDFTSGSRFKCGDTDRDVYRDLVTGLDGTPMPSFASATTADQRWDLVHYIRSLSETKKHGHLVKVKGQ